MKRRLHQVVISSSDEDVCNNEELPREKKAKTNSEEPEAISYAFSALVTSSNLRTDKLNLPLQFTLSNGLSRKCRKIVLTDGGERSWTLDLSFNESSATFYISKGWRNFCGENGLEVGGFIMFELVEAGEMPVFRFCPTETIYDGRQSDCTEPIDEENIAVDGSEDECSSLDSSIDIRTNNESQNLMKRRLHQVVFSSSDEDVCNNEEFPREKKAKTNSEEFEAVSYAFSALVTSSNLRTDKLNLPLQFTLSNGLSRKCRKIVLTDGGERSWALDLSFNESSATFYISKGWRNFCDENGLETGGFIMFELVGAGEKPVFRFCPTETIYDGRQSDCTEVSRREPIDEENISVDGSEDECISLDSSIDIRTNKYTPKRKHSTYSSYSPGHKRFITFTFPTDYARIDKLTLSAPFVRENGINERGKICLLDKYGRKWFTTLLLDKGRVSLGKGWKDFVKANSLEKGFTLKLIWEETTPVLSLYCAESNSDREQEDISKAIEKDSTPSSQEQLLTLTITPSSLKQNRLCLTKSFTRENGIRPGSITLLGKDGIKYPTSLWLDKTKGRMALGSGFKNFVGDNGLKTGDSFTLKLIWEDQNPVLSLCPPECGMSREAGEGHTNKKKSVPIEPSTCKKISKDNNIKEGHTKKETRSADREKNHVIPSSQKQLVTLTITPSSLTLNRLIISTQFAKENGINKPGTIYLLDTDGKKKLTKLQRDKKGTVSLGNGWKEFFAETYDLKPGKSFTMELIWEDTIPMLSLLRSSSKSKKEVSIENRFVTLVLTPEDVKAGKLILPGQFMKSNGIDTLGKITVLSESRIEWSGYLLSRDGTVALGNGWEGFCEANGVKSGQSFTLEFVYKQEDTTPVLKFCSVESRHENVN